MAQVIVESVAAQKQSIARQQVDRKDIIAQLFPHPDCTGDIMSLRVHLRIPLADFAPVNQHLHHCVIDGELGQQVVPQQISAGVACVKKVGAVLLHHRADEGGAHAVQSGVL